MLVKKLQDPLSKVGQDVNHTYELKNSTEPFFSEELVSEGELTQDTLEQLGLDINNLNCSMSPEFKFLMNYFSETSQMTFEYRNSCSTAVQGFKIVDDKVTAPSTPLKALKYKFEDFEIPNGPITLEEYINKLNRDVIPYSVNVSANTYIGHMTSALPSFMTELSKLIVVLNQNMVKVETSKSLSLMERQVLAMTHKKFFNLNDSFYTEDIQNPDKVYGIVTSGGSLANITALISARNKSLLNLGYSLDNIAANGANELLKESGYSKFVILCSRLSHYSVKKAAVTLGIGEKNIKVLAQDAEQKVSIEDLQKELKKCKANSELVVAVIGIAGATETGTVDPLSEMAELCRKHNVHFHVDAAWGGAFKFSNKFSHLLQGIEHADSLTFCAHKQLYLPQGISLLLFRDPSNTGIIPVHANYQAQPGSFDLGQYSLEGSRPALSLLLHSAYHLISEKGYGLLIDNSMEKTAYFKQLLELDPAFEVVGDSPLNIVNYRYIPKRLRKPQNIANTQKDNVEISRAVCKIQSKQFEIGQSFVSKTTLTNRMISESPITVFRAVISNPLVSFQDLKNVLREQLQIAEEVVEGST
ncbi:aminotransferase class V-fold PLP-dependent enzyme [Pseudoalteromonas maricaloris]|uniref:aminotransferase class V-fold PLP-dependent enzyme n=1 Tax=Pseudoalteromonas maricaloris TaxID=184924 RepID=UPI003C22D2B1